MEAFRVLGVDAADVDLVEELAGLGGLVVPVAHAGGVQHTADGAREPVAIGKQTKIWLNSIKSKEKLKSF